MKTTTIELDQFRDHLDQSLAEAEQGNLILTREGKPWIVMRAVSHDRDVGIVSGPSSKGPSSGDVGVSSKESVSLVGRTVSWVRQYLGEAFTIPTPAVALVDGKRVSDDFVLERGQILEFTDEDEDEDWAAELYRSPEFWEMIRQRRDEEAIPWDEVKRRLELE
jgi:hypothetical protein